MLASVSLWSGPFFKVSKYGCPVFELVMLFLQLDARLAAMGPEDKALYEAGVTSGMPVHLQAACAEERAGRHGVSLLPRVSFCMTIQDEA